MAANGFSGLVVHEEIHLFGSDLFKLILAALRGESGSTDIPRRSVLVRLGFCGFVEFNRRQDNGSTIEH